MLGFSDGDVVDRRFRAVLLDLATGRSWDTVVSATTGEVVSSRELDPATEGQPPIIDAEFELVEEILNADAGWLAALAKRGIDPTSVRAVPLSAGVFDYPDEAGRRIVRVVRRSVQDHETDHPLGAPDRRPRRLRRPHHARGRPGHRRRARCRCPPSVGQLRRPRGAAGRRSTPLKPIEITQPEGRSFTVEGNRRAVGKWDLRFGFNEREGLTLHQIGVRRAGRSSTGRRSPRWWCPTPTRRPVRFWQNYFDAGEYLFARYANSLELGCDCLGEIHYFDAVIADDAGRPADHPERDLHARGGLRRPLEAHRPVHRRRARPAASGAW